MTMNETTQGPAATPDTAPQTHATGRRGNRSITGAVVLIVLGLLFLAENFIPDIHFADYWPVLLIAIGASLLWKGRRSS